MGRALYFIQFRPQKKKWNRESISNVYFFRTMTIFLGRCLFFRKYVYLFSKITQKLSTYFRKRREKTEGCKVCKVGITS